MHFIISYHPCHYLCIHDILFHAHTYRIARRSNPTGIQRRGRGESGDTTTSSSKGEEPDTEELLECPDHRPTSFLKGKPWSILSLPLFYKILLESFMIDALGYKS